MPLIVVLARAMGVRQVMEDDHCWNVQQVPLPTKQVLLDVSLLLPQTIANHVERFTLQIPGLGQRQQFGQAAAFLHLSAGLPLARRVNHLRRDQGQSTARVQLTHTQL